MPRSGIQSTRFPHSVYSVLAQPEELKSDAGGLVPAVGGWHESWPVDPPLIQPAMASDLEHFTRIVNTAVILAVGNSDIDFGGEFPRTFPAAFVLTLILAVILAVFPEVFPEVFLAVVQYIVRL